MKLNKITEILDRYYGIDNAHRLYCFKPTGDDEYLECLDFQIKHLDRMFFRLYKGDPIAKIYGRILYDTGHYIYKEIGSINTDYMDNDDNYIIYPSNQIAYSAAIVVDGMNAVDAVYKIGSVTIEHVNSVIDSILELEDRDKQWWNTFATHFAFDEGPRVHDDNVILGKLRLNKINVPFVKNTNPENIVYVKVELPEVLLVDYTLTRFREITNKIVVSIMQDLFGERSVKVVAADEPYKTQEVVKGNDKRVAGPIATNSGKK